MCQRLGVGRVQPEDKAVGNGQVTGRRGRHRQSDEQHAGFHLIHPTLAEPVPPEIRNPNIEIRNKFKARMTEIQNLRESAVLDILILGFGLVSDLVLRISNFVPRRKKT